MRIRVMTENDVPAGLRLNTLSGWNQTSADWQSFLRQSPKGCFVMEQDSKVVGTVTTITYENRFAWIGMVLVDPEYRKQGIGTQLLAKAIEYLDQSRVLAMKLDATPAGKPLYTKLGFVTEYEIERWILKRPSIEARTAAGTSNDFLTPGQLQQLFELDREVFGADRGLLLRSLKTQAPEFALAVWPERSLEGYCFGRSGLFADHLGPWMAANHAAAKKLLHEFLTRSSRDTVIVDCVTSNSSALELLRTFGFDPSRPLTRMVRGPNLYSGRPDFCCAILGPEFG
jgi:ribosomal protein S18 acetylase RimI-like enzyme